MGDVLAMGRVVFAMDGYAGVNVWRGRGGVALKETKMGSAVEEGD